MIKSRLSKRVVIFSALSFILVIVAIILTLVLNTGIKSALSERDTRLDLFENTKMWAIEDVRAYLTVHDEKSYLNVRKTVHMTPELKQSIFGTNFSDFTVSGVKNVSFVDAQYSLGKDGTFMIYMLANAKGTETKELNLLVSVNNNMIYDIIAF
jgi:hypothetical protein